MNILNFFRRQSELVKRIKTLEYALDATAGYGAAHMATALLYEEQKKELEAQNAEYRRIIGGYKAGQTRRANNRSQEQIA